MHALIKSKLVLTLITMILLAGTIAVPLSSSILHSHAASSSSQGSWNIVPSPSPSNSTNPATHYNVLQSVSTYDASHAWAVGWYRNTDGSDHDLIEHWDGTSWSLQTGANPGASINILYGVKALSATNVWAVGYYVDANSNQLVLIEHSTDGGQTWSQDTNSYAGSGVLYSVDGDPSTGDAWAVGNLGSTIYTLTLHLVNGHFSQQLNICQNSDQNTDILLYSVSEHSSSDEWAVGWRHSYFGFVEADTMHFDGSCWTKYSSSNFSPTGIAQLYGVTDIAQNNAWAVGVNFSSSTPTGTLVHWDGSAWSTPINAGYALNSIAATTANNIWAAGSNDGSSPLIYSSDGGSNWNQFAPGGTATFNGITFDKNSGIGWVVGAGNNANSLTDTLIEQYMPPSPPSIIVNPTQGSAGTAVTVTGSGWTLGDVVDISLSTSASVLTKATVAGDGTFSTSFTVPQNATTGTQFVNAKDETTGQTAQAAFTVTRKQLFILLQGLSSQLTIDQILNNQHPTFDDTAGIMLYLQGHGYSADTDFLEYSYPVDFPPSTPKAFQQSVLQSIHPYSCFDTFDHSLNQDVRTLDLQIRYYLQQRGHENTDVYLIGDSLGGAIGFGYLALLKTQAWSSLPNGGQLKGVITLDAPVGGIQTGNDLQAIQVAFDTKCGRLTYPPIKALNDLGSVYNTSTTDIPLGGTANMIAVIFPNFSTPTGFDNQQLADEAVIHGIRVLTIGNVKDYGYAMSGCVILNKANKFLKLQDFVSSQFVHDEGVPSGVYGRAIDKALSSICDVNSISLEINHGVVLTNSDVEQGIVSFINGNDPSPLLLPPQLIA